ncbi:hypothetical protein HK105_208438 [Polyrhizophydium stewartii]|uniref:Ankyrin repeat protein n=1 Tax=Polyrhizophydium stewartii TaxID=2732419 RepID=A0ABR4MXU5_9FUNG
MLGARGSHWDRLPRELRDMVLAHAGPLTQLTTGRIGLAHLGSLDFDGIEQLWHDVIECEWPGDLERLPGRSWLGSHVFWGVRSRHMYDRLRAVGGWGSAAGLWHAAARCRFDDELRWLRPLELSLLAAEAGAQPLLSDLVGGRERVRLQPAHVRTAAAWGHLHLVRWLHERMADGSWPKSVMDRAAAGGHLHVVRWLHEHRSEGCSHEAMDGAARAGRLHVVRWLHEHRTEGCSRRALDWAVLNSHRHVADWLRTHRPGDVAS